MNYCNYCVYPEIAVNLNFDENNKCSSCRTFENLSNCRNNFGKKEKKV